MHLNIHFSSETVKALAAAWQRARDRGDRRPLTRITALHLVGQRPPVPTVAAWVGVAESTRAGWVAAFLLQGVASLVYRSSPGRPGKLTPSQKQRLTELLDRSPEAAGFAYSCWAAPVVPALIDREFGVLYTIHYSSELLHNVGYSYQKARFVSDPLDEERRATWLQTEWPAVLARARASGALLLFGDAARFAQWGSLGYTWARRAAAPVVPPTGRRKGYKVGGLLDWLSGRLWYAGHAGRCNATTYCAFLASVRAQTTERLIIVQDGARYHPARQTQEWVAQHADRVAVVQLPSYSPDYNPIEHGWKYVKQATHNAYFTTFGALTERVEMRLQQLQSDAARTLQVMGSPLVAYRNAPAAA